MRNLILTLLFISITFNGFSQYLKVEKMILDNGLTVFLSEDHTRPEVFGGVITKAGGKNDPKDATGMAHYMEHMLFKGTQELGTTDWEKEKPHIDKIFELYDQLGKTTDEEVRKSIQTEINQESLKAGEYAIPNELSNVIKSMGGTNLNAGTGPDNTMFYNAFPPNQIEKWLDLYSHRFMDPVFRSFQAELEVVYEEKNMYSDMFIFPLLEELNKNFFKNHPYGQQTLIGTAEDLKNPSLTKMKAFFDTYYVANNMGLIIVGDIDIEKIKPIIKEKFGQWRSGEVPEPVIYEEKPFNGKEVVNVKMTPIKLGLLGFRTVPSGHPDEIALTICNGILSNSNSTGLLDQLALDNQLMAAQVLNMPYLDHGATYLLYIPKIIGQKLEAAEQLVLDQLQKLKAGEFEDWMVEAIKNEQYKYYMTTFESIEDKALMIATTFSEGKDIEELNLLPEKVQKITKEEVIKVANKYYGENYLAFNSKMGFPKKEKIDKPGYEPLIANTNATSVYTNRFNAIQSTLPEEKFIDFDKAVKTTSAKGGIVYRTQNPLNDIFTMKIKFGIGEYKNPMLKYASSAMNYAGTDEKTINELKNEFSKIGCSYGIYSDKSYTTIELEGIEKNFDQAIALLSELIYAPKLDQKKIDNIVDENKTERKMEKTEPDNVASALLEYVRYKNKSSFIDRLSMKEIKALKAEDLVASFKESSQYFTEIHLVAQNDLEDKSQLLEKTFKLNEDKKPSDSPIYLESEKYNENTVFFVNKKKARQSKIFFMVDGAPFDINKKAYIDEFNMYFGGGFSGLVLQEVREYRSLAYSAGAGFRIPALKNKPTYFIGFIGTQADKTNEVIDVFHELVRNMPSKTERAPMIKDYLIQSAFTGTPNFRDMSQSIADWKLQGYTEDPAKVDIEIYKSFKFEDIENFYKTHLKDAKVVTVIVGDGHKIDLKKIASYGKIVPVKEKILFK